MFIGKDHELSRRAFMHRSSQLAAMGAASSYALGLSGVADAAAAITGVQDYKALVCVFLYGGNDYGNTLIPYDAANYAKYSSLRGGDGTPAGGGVALPQASLANTVLNLPTGQVLTDNIIYALAPNMPQLKALYDRGVMAPVLNVGPLEAPMTRQDYDSGRVPRPPKLFSHNDQQSQWQASSSEGALSGYGGRIADLALGVNTNAMFTAINVTGNAVFVSGRSAVPYTLTSSGATIIDALRRNNLFGSSAGASALDQVLRQHSGNLLAADYAMVNQRSIQYGKFVNDALAAANVTMNFASNNGLASQLRTVARMIAQRDQIGVRRQVFMVSLGGFDNHNSLTVNHRNNLALIDEALGSFYGALDALGVARQVTTFTASDFGRTYSTNGDGSDHGWGSHHFVVGGAVRGGRFYGRSPEISITGNDQVGRGRLLPTISVDAYTTTLALWFGVPPSDLVTIAPNIGRFPASDLGFMDRSNAAAQKSAA